MPNLWDAVKERRLVCGNVQNKKWGYLYAETAHIKNISHFPRYDVKENMLCLCANCHKNLDNKIYKLSESSGRFVCDDIISHVNYSLDVKPQHELTLFP
jgi:predicted restriction endonuclease